MRGEPEGIREEEKEEAMAVEEGRHDVEGAPSLRQRRSYGARARTGMSYVILLGDSLTGVAWRTLTRCRLAGLLRNWKILPSLAPVFPMSEFPLLRPCC